MLFIFTHPTRKSRASKVLRLKNVRGKSINSMHSIGHLIFCGFVFIEKSCAIMDPDWGCSYINSSVVHLYSLRTKGTSDRLVIRYG